jgi:hypothetical protein
MSTHILFTEANARAFTPTASESDYNPGKHGNLAEQSLGDWSWKPYRYGDGRGNGGFRFLVTGERCTCTLSAPVGTSCARHN